MKFLIAVLASVVGVVAGAPVPPRFHESDDRDPKSKNLRQGVNTPAIAPVGLAGGVAIARSFTTSVQNVGYVWGNADKIYIKVENGECHNFSYLRYNQGVCGWVYGDNYPESRHVWAHYTGETKESCMTNCAWWDRERDEGVSVTYSIRDLSASYHNSDCYCYSGRAGSVTSPASGDAVSDYDVYECWGKLPHPDHWSVSPVCDTDERSVCDTAGYDRRLSATLSSTGNGLGHVVHVTASGQVARAEVVAAVALALDGGDGFEALVDNATTRQGQLLVLDKDNMEYDSGEVDHPDGAFTVQNAFVHSHPDIMYRVTCPAKADGAMCQVEAVDGGAGQWFGECILPADRPVASDACLDAAYEVSLFALPNAHFLLGAAGPGGDCPDVALFAGRDGRGGGKRRVRYSPAVADIPAHVVGTASLRAVLAAEARTPDPAARPFDMASNTCLHYAGAIWRELGLREDTALADFIVENIVARSGSGEVIARHLAEKDPTAVAGSGLHSDIIKKAVYSQMEL